MISFLFFVLVLRLILFLNAVVIISFIRPSDDEKLTLCSLFKVTFITESNQLSVIKSSGQIFFLDSSVSLDAVIERDIESQADFALVIITCMKLSLNRTS